MCVSGFPFLAAKSRRFITGILPGTPSLRVEYRSNALAGRRDRDQSDGQSCSDADAPYFESSFMMDEPSTLTIRDSCTAAVRSCSAYISAKLMLWAAGDVAAAKISCTGAGVRCEEA